MPIRSKVLICGSAIVAATIGFNLLQYQSVTDNSTWTTMPTPGVSNTDGTAADVPFVQLNRPATNSIRSSRLSQSGNQSSQTNLDRSRTSQGGLVNRSKAVQESARRMTSNCF